jgi:hypothetical protein
MGVTSNPAFPLVKLAYDWKLLELILLAVAIPVFTLQKEQFGPKQIKSAMKRTIMETIINDVFDGDKIHTRVTIFREVSWVRLCGMLISNAVRHPIQWLKKRGKGVPKLGRYLKVVNRIGTENEKSSIYFYFSKQTSRHCEGIVGLARQTETEIRVEDLPDISGVDLTTVDLTSKSQTAKKVKLYMNRGRIEDIETLKRLHVRARHFYANVLYNSNSEPVGVLVIDNNEPISPFTADRVDKLSAFVKLLSPTF